MTTQEFTFTGTGTLKRVDTFVSKAGKSMLTLIIEVEGQYPQLIPCKIFGRLVEDSAAWTPGSVLAVRGRLGGRDWQGKVYGDITATRVDVVTQGAAQSQGAAPAMDQTDPGSVPF